MQAENCRSLGYYVWWFSLFFSGEILNDFFCHSLSSFSEDVILVRLHVLAPRIDDKWISTTIWCVAWAKKMWQQTHMRFFRWEFGCLEERKMIIVFWSFLSSSSLLSFVTSYIIERWKKEETLFRLSTLAATVRWFDLWCWNPLTNYLSKCFTMSS